ncbi:MAG: hypothetical protein JSU72_11065, partial [Deltaproteobacteria bacterium]
EGDNVLLSFLLQVRAKLTCCNTESQKGKELKMKTVLRFCCVFLSLFAFVDCGSVPLDRETGSSVFYDFEESVGPAWSVGPTYRIDENRVLGLFNDENRKFSPTCSLILSDLPPDQQIRLSFDLYLIGTWDSGGKLADRWELRIKDGDSLIAMTQFPNKFKDPKEKIPDGNDGFVKVYRRPRAYWRVNLETVITADKIRGDQLVLVFYGDLTGRKTEFWALDNVHIRSLTP